MAEPFETFTSRVIPLPAENVDTDQIVPARYLKVTDKAGLAEALFRDWRFEEDGVAAASRGSCSTEPAMAGRQILLAGDNFGAGSSREHAPWALTSWGIRAILSTSFADIFRNNALKNGLLPIVVEADEHRHLFELVEANPDAELTVDLEAQVVHLPGRRGPAVRRRPVRPDDAPRRHRRDGLPARQDCRHRRAGRRPTRPASTRWSPA